MHDALIALGNGFLRANKPREAAYFYQNATNICPELAGITTFNLQWLETKHLKPIGQALADWAEPYAFVTAGSYAKKLTTLSSGLNAQKLTRFDLEERFYAIYLVLTTANSVTKPLVSVIMPTFNRAAILLDSVQTVLQQSYPNWELLICDDGSTDNTAELVNNLNDKRVRYLKQDKKGAAAARNLGLSQAKGDFITYLDTDNFWHPDYLQLVSLYFSKQPSQLSLYFDYIDYKVSAANEVTIMATQRPPFSHEQLLTKPFIDLNTFAHRKELYTLFGGFDESLSRRQDYDVILKYTWLKDPLHIPLCVALYQRNENFSQITRAHKDDQSPVSIINNKVANYFANGLPVHAKKQKVKVSVLIWDMCRNHFSKAFSVAEALSATYDVELISFDFFDEGIFEPFKNVTPSFSVKYFKGADFPDFFDTLKQALDAITGDILYVVKPRLPSMGLAMLANYERKIPFVLEINDLETVVNKPGQHSIPSERVSNEVAVADKNLLVPHSDMWSEILDSLAQKLPFVVSHNKNLDNYYCNNTMLMRNIKDEAVFNPENYNRDAVRNALGFAKEDRVILFGGLIRKHKGVFELVELLQKLNDSRYKVLFVASRVTPDQQALLVRYGDRIKMLPSQDREGMAKINLAADLVVLWLNPEIAASHYQFPYKATDAFAMETPVIANDISDLGDLAKQGYLTEVPFGDWGAMQSAIKTLFDNSEYRTKQVAAARRLFLRQFSYAAARTNFELMLHRVQKQPPYTYSASAEFASLFEQFYSSITGNTGVLKR